MISITEEALELLLAEGEAKLEVLRSQLHAARAVMDKGANIGWGTAVTVEIERQQNLREQAQAETKEWQLSCGALTVLRREVESERDALKLKLEAAKTALEKIATSILRSRADLKYLARDTLSQLDGEAVVKERGPTCRDYRLAIGDDQGKAMGVPMSEELLGDWIARGRP